ncbi:EpsG family protein [Vibrio breoganii]|uniref:EpsG family protein n=1 Tax=Vibrio breoganii TaxID=553239 RepID=UPI000C83FFF2|nr:hypothetical protein BCT84_13100 [Vibrio breoganii]
MFLVIKKRIDYRIIIGLFFVILACLIASSRQIFILPSDDFTRYYETYTKAFEGNIIEFIGIENREPLFQIFNYIIALLFGTDLEPRIFMLILMVPISLFHLLSLNLGDSVIKNRCHYYWLLVFVPFIIYESQLIRQALSFALLIFGMLSINKSRYIVLLFAFFTHYFSILLYILFIVSRKLVEKSSKKSIKNVLVLVLLGSLLSPYIIPFIINNLLFIDAFSVKLKYYSNIDIKPQISVMYLLILVINVIFLWTCYPIKNSKVYLNLYTIVFLFYSLSSFSIFYMELGQRFYIYMMYFLPIILAALSSKVTKEYRFLVPSFLYLFFVVFSLRYLTAHEGSALLFGWLVL